MAHTALPFEPQTKDRGQLLIQRPAATLFKYLLMQTRLALVQLLNLFSVLRLSLLQLLYFQQQLLNVNCSKDKKLKDLLLI